MQLAGQKSWEVRGPSRTAPMYRDAEPNREPSESIVWSGTMTAGDVMHIPRGYWHQATRTDRGDGHSLHVTFGFVKRTGVDWLSWVADRARERELFRHDLDRYSSDAERAEQEQRLRLAASELLADYPIETYLSAREAERPPPRHVATGGVFGPPTAVVCVADFPPRIDELDIGVQVIAAGKLLTFAARAARALRMLLSGHPAVLSSVSEATGVDAATLADTLLNDGVCAELTEELSSGCIGLVPTGT